MPFEMASHDLPWKSLGKRASTAANAGPTFAFHIGADYGQLFSQPRGSLLFAQTVARAEKFGGMPFKSLSKYFGVSPTAMAIRLEELGLVAAYLPMRERA
jgi:hypothetical protein